MAKYAKARAWATVLYPESMQEDFLSVIGREGVSAMLSPLHDRDVNPDGTPKKAHYHLIIQWEGPVTDVKAKRYFKLIGGVGCEQVTSTRGYARYLCHLDNPEKCQYDINDVKCFCGADYQQTIALPSDRYGMISDIIDFVDKYNIYSFAWLMRFAKEYKTDWFRILCDNSSRIINDYLKSKKWEAAELSAGNLKDVPIENIAIVENLVKPQETENK